MPLFSVQANDQLTDGGPSVTLELPSCLAGRPFGAVALGWLLTYLSVDGKG